MSWASVLGLLLQLALSLMHYVKQQQLKTQVERDVFKKLWEQIDETARAGRSAWDDPAHGAVDVSNDPNNRDNRDHV